MLCMDGKDVFLGGAFDDTADLKLALSSARNQASSPVRLLGQAHKQKHG